MSGIEISLWISEYEALNITSDGEGRYKIRATGQLRHDLAEPDAFGLQRYETDDDLHVRGLIDLVLGAAMSQEHLKRKLHEHYGDD